MSRKFFFNSETLETPLDDGPDDNINRLNDLTFGSGAVEDSWQNEHNQFAEQHTRSHHELDVHGHHVTELDEDALELSNQQLAAAVEELVLNSDQDQDAIDPAIVSLRKESRPGSYNPRLTENLMSPYMGERDSFGQDKPAYSSQSSSSSVFQSDGMRNIWSSTDSEVQDSFLVKSPSMLIERQQLNEKLKKMMMRKNNESPPFQDEAILSAVKTSSSGNWPISSHPQDLHQHLFPHNPAMLRAEDLEREFSSSQLRGPSPTFGISIPKENDVNHDATDRSLPARSVSPIIGSPSSHTMPIGTPPKHIAEMMHQQALRNRVPIPHPNFPHPMRPMGTPPRGFFLPPGIHPPGGMMIPPRPWPAHNMMNRPAVNPVIAQDIMNRLGIMSASPPANMSPIGSPHFVQAPRMPPRPNVGFSRPMMMGGPGGNIPPGFRGHQRPPGPFPNQRFGGPPHPMRYLGPGHLHPEHSRFVRMRRQMNNRNRPYGNQYHNQRGHDRDHSRNQQSFLMSNREKEWVIKIQMMALQSDRPEIDDYYYQHYIEKRLREGALSLDDDPSEQKRLITPTKANPEMKKYVPVQFDNSLGKLTVSSAYNPRQIIDVVHAEKEDDVVAETVDTKMNMNKRLEIYKLVEKAYFLVMTLEELNSSLENVENMREELRLEKEQNIEEQVKSLEEVLLLSTVNSKENNSSDTISQILKIRKGKRLFCRALPLISKNAALNAILVLIRQMSILIKRDQREDILQELYKPICDILKEVDSDRISQVCASLVPILGSICKDKFGLSVVCKVLIIGHNHPDLCEKASDNGKTWHNFVNSALSTLVTLSGKSENSLPLLLEKSLGSEVLSQLEKHVELGESDDKISKLTSSNLKSMKRILTSQLDDGDVGSELLGTKRLSPEA